MTNTNTVTLPQAGIDHMSPNAQQHLPPNISPRYHVVFDDPSVNNQFYFGTAGVTDVFVFDLSQRQVTDTFDLIFDFEVGQDVIAFINAPSDFTYNVGKPFAIKDPPQPIPPNDPLKPDTGLHAVSTITSIGAHVNVYDATSPTVHHTIRIVEGPGWATSTQYIELVIQRSRGMWPYLVKAALVTGIREEALVSAKRDYVSHDLKQITVVDKGNKRRTVDLRPMGGYEFFTTIPAFAGKPWLFWRTADKCVRKDSQREATVAGDRIEDPSAEFVREVKRVAAWAEENGVEFYPFTFHALRHKHAIEYLRHGGNIYDLQKRLGHSSLAQTEAYLQFLTPEQQRTATHGDGALKKKRTA